MLQKAYKRTYIEISNICNLQCSFCPVVERDNLVLRPEHFKKVLEQVAPITNEVCLHLMGEPLAHPHLAEIFKICEELAVKVQLTTNGVNIKSKMDLLTSFSSLRQINFSLQSYKDNFPDRPLQTYLEPIFEFTKALNFSRPEVYINYRLWNIGRSSSSELDNADIFDAIENSFEIKINRQVQTESIKSKKIWNKLYLHFDDHFDWPSWDEPDQGELGRCHALTGHFGIHADGTVVPCCLHYLQQ
jgi:MoaA/NifB/PqqE/SkfB family radical SAM enzyme